jgi:uncharacterized protein
MSDQAVSGEATMTIDYVIGDLQTSEHAVPRASMQWALDHWDDAAPRCLELLSRFADGNDRTTDAEIALFFISRLVAEKAETRAFRDLCRLFIDRTVPLSLAGDAFTPVLSQILISTFDGDVDLLHSVVEGADVDEFIRHAAITAIAYLTRIGRIPEADTRDWLRCLVTDMQPQDKCFVWIGWAECVADLGLPDLVPDAQRLFERGCINGEEWKFPDFLVELKRTLDNPDPMAPFALRELKPFTEGIDELEGWYNSSEPGAPDESWDDDDDEEEETGSLPRAWSSSGGDRNPWRNVGRNDPCPCGSGKKFKKCCLGKPDAEPPFLTVTPRGGAGSRRSRFEGIASD